VTWHRIGTGSIGAFVLVLAFLAGRMNGGADPGLAKSAVYRLAGGAVGSRTLARPAP
jgi:hypothetical protein